MLSHQLDRFRTRVRRSPNGKVLGVFKGLAESMGWPVRRTRILGVLALIFFSGSFSGDGFQIQLLSCGACYVLLAWLMGPTRPAAVAYAYASGGQTVDWRAGRKADGSPLPAAVPSELAPRGPRVDLAQLDRQLDGLSRRIRRMEAIVTDRQYDWERRLGQP